MAKKANEKLNVAEKANKPLAKNLSALIGKDVSKLAKYLECSTQAINQYKQGTSVPQLNKLVKIAKYYNVTTDYLLGLSKEKTTDPKIKEICEYTGLSEEAVSLLHRTKNRTSSIASSVLSNLNFYAMLGKIEKYRQLMKIARDNEEWLIEGNHYNPTTNFPATKEGKEANFELFQIQKQIYLIAEDGVKNG